MLQWAWVRKRSIGGLLALMVVIGPAWSAAYGQRARSAVTPATMLADQLVMQVRHTLSGTDEPFEDQLVQSRVLLDLALQLEPDNAELWKLRAELATLEQDEAAHQKALGRYLELRPDDDATYLNLLLKLMQKFQTLDERVAKLSAILESKQGQRLSDPLRSRLASYIAQAARDLGDEATFRKYLDQARTLDASNQAAAEMMYRLVETRQLGQPIIAAALMNTVRSEPMNAATRRRFASFLTSHGIFDAAAEQFGVSYDVGQPLGDIDFCYDWVMSLACSGETDKALAVLDQFQRQLNQAAQREQERLLKEKQKAEQAASGLPAPLNDPQATEEQAPRLEPVQLPIDLETLRLAIYFVTGDQARVDGAFGRLRIKLDKKFIDGDEQSLVDLTMLAVLFDQARDQRAGWIQQIAQKRPKGDPMVMRLQAYHALRLGQRGRALSLLGAMSGTDPYAAYGQAQAQTLEDQARRVELLNQTVELSPLSLTGMLAAMELDHLGSPYKPQGDANQIAVMYQQWSPFIRKPEPLNVPWVSIEVTVEPARFTYLEPIPITVVLRNITDRSLGLGEDGTLPTNMVVYASADLQGRDVALPPVVIDLDRRITLDPGETLSVTSRLDYGALGDLLTAQFPERIGLSFTAFLDPVQNAEGNITTGPLGLTARQRSYERRGLAVTNANLHEWLDFLDDPDPIDRFKALARLIQFAPMVKPDSDGADLVAPIADKINQRFPNMDPLEQAWVVRFLAPGERGEELFKRVHELARRSDDTRVRMIYLMRMADDPESPLVNAALRMGDPTVTAFASALRVRLQREKELEQKRIESERDDLVF